MRVMTLLCAVMSVSGCPSALQSTPSALCRATVDCPAAQICDLSDRQYGVCVPSCGNSTVESWEECDDGNTVNNDGCTNTCLVCGNGVKADGEACDDGDAIDANACTNSCRLAMCGDGVTRTDLSDEAHVDFEFCDDGNRVDTDACSNNCVVGFCGDGVLRTDLAQGDEGYEACDDGNRVLNDACAECQPARCGDGILRNDIDDTHPDHEPCDDGDDDDTDECRNGCIMAKCGDGVVRTDLPESDGAYEACDDANFDQTDACANNCRLARCGDGHVRAGVEECDDADSEQDGTFGVVNSNDGACTETCRIARCGDGFLRRDLSEGEIGYEACDDGNTEDGDGCSASCVDERVNIQRSYRSSDQVNIEIECVDDECQICRPQGAPGEGTCLTVVPFEGATFTMGTNDAGAIDALPPHQVSLGGFFIAKTETTKAQWSPCHEASTLICDDNVALPTLEDEPVGADWDSSLSFCRWFGGRLPTEAEWEFAASSRGSRLPYPWGRGVPNCLLAYSDEICDGNLTTPARVCQEQRISADGLCDVAGNSEEWTLDRIAGDLPQTLPDGLEQPITNPVYEIAGVNAIVRGGSYRSRSAHALRVASRRRERVTSNNLIYSFRCVWSAVTLEQMTRR